MKNRVIKFFLGVSLVLLIINLMQIERNEKQQGYVNYLATFNKIDGVNVGSDVMMSGIKVGEVSKIFLENNYPVVKMFVDESLKITIDSSVSIQTDGLFGSKFLSIEIGGMDTLMENGDSFSYSEDSILIQDLLKNIINIGERNKL